MLGWHRRLTIALNGSIIILDHLFIAFKAMFSKLVCLLQNFQFISLILLTWLWCITEQSLPMRVWRAASFLWTVVIVRISIRFLDYWRPLAWDSTLIMGWHAESSTINAMYIVINLTFSKSGVTKLVFNFHSWVSITEIWAELWVTSYTQVSVLTLL